MCLSICAKKKHEQYKKVTRVGVTYAVKGNLNKIKAVFEKRLQADANELESRFMLVIRETQLGNLAAAMDLLKENVKRGMPLGRFVAGPRNLLKKLHDYQQFKDLIKAEDIRLLHGPIVGSVTESRARIWLRTAKESQVSVEASLSENFSKIAAFGQGNSKAVDDYTVTIELNGLEAGQKYVYRMKIDGEQANCAYEQSFRSFPKKDTNFSVIFGGGAGYNPQYEHMWNNIVKHQPTALLQLGDNVYHDALGIEETQRYCYYRRYSRPEFRQAMAQTPMFALYDDHDFGDNDSWGGTDKNFPAWKHPSLKVFTENFANPSYGGGAQNPGVWYSFSIGEVDFFMLDCRYYRENPQTKKTGKTMLGSYQKKWLKDKLKNSTAKFKVICPTVPIAPGAKPGPHGKDTWDGYPEERQEIFDFLKDHKINGAFVVSADRHRSDAWKIERPGTYPIYEFMSSRFTNVHTHAVMPGSLFGYNKKCSFGKLNFDMQAASPSVTYEIYSIDNEKIHSMTLKLSELQ